MPSPMPLRHRTILRPAGSAEPDRRAAQFRVLRLAAKAARQRVVIDRPARRRRPSPAHSAGTRRGLLSHLELSARVLKWDA